VREVKDHSVSVIFMALRVEEEDKEGMEMNRTRGFSENEP